MRAALVASMDAVLFAMKRGHLSGARFARRALRPFELTPARFDLMKAIGDHGARQCDLWRRLNVVRSVVSETLRALLALGWVKRVRAADSRTWLVFLTKRGRELFERAYAKWVESGDVALYIDAVLVNRHFECDPGTSRWSLIMMMWSFIEEFGWLLQGSPSLYPWDPEEHYELFADTDIEWSCGVPFVTQWNGSTEST